jgi:adenosylhomocysteinase
MAFSTQSLEPNVYDVPDHIDKFVADLKLSTLGVRIDKLTKSQKKYLRDWKEGT